MNRLTGLIGLADWLLEHTGAGRDRSGAAVMSHLLRYQQEVPGTSYVLQIRVLGKETNICGGTGCIKCGRTAENS